MKQKSLEKNPDKKRNNLKLFIQKQLNFTDLYELAFELNDKKAIIITDLNGTVKISNQKAAELLRYSMDELKNFNAKKLLYYSADKAIYNFTIDSFPRRARGVTVECFLVKKDRSTVFVEIEAKIVPTRKKNRQQQFIVNFLNDIYKRNESLQIFIKHFMQSKEGYLILKKDGTIYMANPEFAKLVEKPLLGVKPKKIWSICPNFLTKKALNELVVNDEVKQDIIKLKTKKSDGSKTKILNVISQSIHLDSKIFIQCLCRDITEIIQKNHKILKQQQSLQKQKSELEAFAANIAHDVKGKLQAIRIYNDLLKTELPKTVNYADKIDELIDEMVKFIDNSLLLAKEGEILGKQEEFELEEVIGKITRKIAIINPAITIQIGELPRIFGDKKKIQIVFENLLLNALIHSSATEINITATTKEDSFVIKIVDNGKGIPQKKQEQILEGWETGTFYSFGLMIAKKIIDAHHGTISFESKEGKGTTFIVSLPKTKIAEPK